MPIPDWWPRPPLYVPSHAGPDKDTLRACGCHADPVVFGHCHTYISGHRAPAGAA